LRVVYKKKGRAKGVYNPLDKVPRIKGTNPSIMNIGMIPNTIPALAFVSRHDFAVSVELAGVVLL
jgi:hypothetical protein